MMEENSARSLKETLSALREIIVSSQSVGNEHEPTPTEYFALILTSISGGAATDKLPELLKVLAAVIPQSSKSILSSQFKILAQILLNILRVNEDNITVLYLSLTTLGPFLKAQDSSDGVWGSVHAMQSINAFLSFIDDGRPKLRKAGQEQLHNLLVLHHTRHVNVLRSYVADFCIEIIKACTRSSYKRAFMVVMFLERSLGLLHADKIARLIELCLGLQSCGLPKLTAAVYRVLDCYFQSIHSTMSHGTLLKNFQLSLSSRPDTLDMEVNVYYAAALASGVVAIHKNNRAASHTVVLAALANLIEICDSEFTQVHTAVGTALKRTLCAVVDPQLVAAAAAPSQGREGAGNGSALDERLLFQRIMTGFESLFRLKFQYSWLYTLDSARSLFDILKRYNGNFSVFQGLVTRLADIYQAVEYRVIELEPSLHMALSETLGAALRSCGVSRFLQFVPFLPELSPSQRANAGTAIVDPLSSFREWLLRIFHETIVDMPCTIASFNEQIVPVASKFSKAIAINPTSPSTGLYRNRILQLWSLFPDFCQHHCTDIHASFPKMLKTLTGLFADSRFPEIVPHVVNALCHLATGVHHRKVVGSTVESSEFTTLQEHSVTFIPLLLKSIEDVDMGSSSFQNTVQALTAWIAISTPQFVNAVAKKLLQLVLTNSSAGTVPSTEDGDKDAVASKWLVVMLHIIPYLNETMVLLLYRTVRPLISIDESIALQKRAYSVLNALLHTHSDSIFSKVEGRVSLISAVSNSLLTCQVGARGTRFKCIETILSDMNDLDQLSAVSEIILGEILICQKDANKKTRDSALNILRTFVQAMDPVQLVMQLTSGLVGETSVMRSSAVSALCMLFVEHRDNEIIVAYMLQLFPTVCLLLQEQSTDQTKAVLAFVRVASAVLPLETLKESLGLIVSAFTEQLGAQKSRFPSRCRGIMRKLVSRLGDESAIREHLSDADVPLLDYVCRAARRSMRRKDQQRKQVNSKAHFDALMGSDSDDDDEEGGDDDDDDDEGGRNDSHGRGKAGGGAAVARDEDISGPMTGIVLSSNRASEIITDKEDYRLGARPKATKAAVGIKQSTLNSSMPTTLDDLLEDQAPIAATRRDGGRNETVRGGGGGGGGGSNSTARARAFGEDLSTANVIPDDEDALFSVVVTTDGKVVIQERPLDAPSDGNAAGRKRKSAEEEAAAAAVAEEEQHPRASVKEEPNKKRKFTLKEPGIEYRSKKAGGDVWKKGMMEPHAFIPLDARLLSKKNHQFAVDHFDSVIQNRNVRGGNNNRPRSKRG